MKQTTQQTIDYIFDQASKGFVEIGDEEYGYWSYYTKFYANVEG